MESIIEQLRRGWRRVVVCAVMIASLIVAFFCGPLIPVPPAKPFPPTGAATQDYVDNNTSNVDSVVDKGGHSDFENEKATDSVNDILYEANQGSDSTPINAESFEGTWLPTGWTEDSGSAWNKDNSQKYSGTYSAGYEYASGMTTGSLYTIKLNTAAASSIIFWFYFYDILLDPTDIRVFYNDSNGGWDAGVGITASTENQWNLFNVTLTDSQYFHQQFIIKFQGGTLGTGENGYLDYFTMKIIGAINYNINLEIQWTSITSNDADIERVCIKTGSFGGSEDLDVSIRNTTSNTWQSLASDMTASTWNNYSITGWLGSSTVTITLRFLGGIETSDSTQDMWDVDGALIYTRNYTTPTISDDATWNGTDAYWVPTGSTIVFNISVSCTNYEGGGLDHYIFSWNASGSWANTTYAFDGGLATEYANLTKTLSVSVIPSLVQFKWYVNSTDDQWDTSNTYEFHVTFEMMTLDMGGGDIFFGKSPTYYEGAARGIYVSYTNVSCEMYQVRGYNVDTETWTSPKNITDTPSPDRHWEPTIGVMPNGSIACFWGYMNFIKCRITTQSADTQSNLSTLLGSWKAETTVDDGTNSYPLTFSFDDVLVLLYRQGSADGGDIYYRRFTTSWSAATRLTDFGDTYCPYLDHNHNLQDGKILLGFNRKPTALNYAVNALFCYSGDKGVTWKKVDGTTLSLPFSATDVQIDSTSTIAATSACLDENGKPVIVAMYHKDGLENAVRLYQYSATLGSSGSWSNNNMTDDNGNKIYAPIFLFAQIFSDPCFDDRLSFWTRNNTGTYSSITKYVRQSGSTFQFQTVYFDEYRKTNRTNTALIQGFQAVGAYQIQVELNSSYELGGEGIVYGAGFELTGLSVGWNELSAWTEDVGHTLGEVNASLTADSLEWQYIVLWEANGDQRGIFILGIDWDYDVVVVTGDQFEIWCDAEGSWTHTYG